MSVRVESQLPQFINKTEKTMDTAMGMLAAEVLRASLMVVPKGMNKAGSKKAGKKIPKNYKAPGQLRSSGKQKKISVGHYQITYGDNPSLAYARRREYEAAKHYSTPGTHSKYLSGSGEIVARNAVNKLKEVFK